MKQCAKLVENVTSSYGSIRTISKHKTWLEAVKAGVAYRNENPNANMLEIYAYNQPLGDGRFETSHSLECREMWAKFANEGEK